MNTKQDDVKLLAEAYGKIYKEETNFDSDNTDNFDNFDNFDNSDEVGSVGPTFETEPQMVYIVYDVDETGDSAIHRVFGSLEAAEQELSEINDEAGYDRWDILEMEVE